MSTGAPWERVKDGLVVFRFADLVAELRAFREVVRAYLEPESDVRLGRLGAALETLALSAAGKTHRWEGRLDTIPSEGRHQPGRGGHGYSLRGVVRFTWQLQPLGQPAGNKAPLQRWFALRNSSVALEFRDAAGAPGAGPLASWHLDVGDDASPGCHFHAQAPGPVDVPRIPTLLFMPTDAVEFVLGELWQEEWHKYARSSVAHVKHWKSFPAQRLTRLLKWHAVTLANSTATPWMLLKAAKPKAGLFCEA